MTITDRTGSAGSTSTANRQAGLASSVSRKGPCIVASTSALTLSGEQTIDGVAVVDGDRVLYAKAGGAVANGIYIVSTGAWSRSPDFARNDDVMEGSEVRVTRGSNAGVWVVSTTGDIVVDTTSITFDLDASSIAGALLAALNLSDLSSKRTSWINLTGATASIAATATTDLTAATGIVTTITGNTNISAFTMTDQELQFLRFTGTPQITVSASLVGNNAGQPIQIEAGDFAIVRRNGATVYFIHLPVRNRALSKWSASVSSAGTVSLPEGIYGHITGTTTITDVDWDIAVDGKLAIVEFDSALTITHSSTLKCPGSTNLSVSAGGVVMFIQDSGDTVRVVPLFTTSTTVTGTIDEWIPAGAFIPQITNGPSAGIVEMATNKQPLTTLDFDTTTAERAVCWWRPPKRWDGGNITFEAYWTAASGSGGVAWGIDGVAYSDDDALDAAYGTQVVVTDTLITANDCHITAASAAVTIAGSPADADLVALRISREPANGSDTLAVDAKLIGIAVHWTASAGTDA